MLCLNQLVLQRLLILNLDIQITFPYMWFKFGNRVVDCCVLEVSSNAIIWSSHILDSILQLSFFAIVISLMVGRIAPIRLCALRCWNEVGCVLRVISCHYSLLTLRIWWPVPSPIDAWWAVSSRLTVLFVIILRSLCHFTLITFSKFFQTRLLLCLLIILIGHAESLIHLCIIALVDLRIDKFVQVFP